MDFHVYVKPKRSQEKLMTPDDYIIEKAHILRTKFFVVDLKKNIEFAVEMNPILNVLQNKFFGENPLTNVFMLRCHAKSDDETFKYTMRMWIEGSDCSDE